MVDAAILRDPSAVAEAIAEWAASRFEGPVAVVDASMLTGGFDNFVHAFRLDGATLPPEWRAELVVRVSPSGDRGADARTETEIQNWCVASGYPAARVLALLEHDWSLDRPARDCRARAGHDHARCDDCFTDETSGAGPSTRRAARTVARAAVRELAGSRCARLCRRAEALRRADAGR